MIDISKFVFLDTETTGLNFNEHQILELSYAVGDGEIITLYEPSDQPCEPPEKCGRNWLAWSRDIA